MNAKTKLALYVAGGLFAYWQYAKAKAALVETVTTTLNPASEQNFIYQGTQSTGKSLGKWLFEVTH